MTGPPLPQRPPDDVESFCARVRSFNPFVDNRVNGLAADGVDVSPIHAAEFERLTALAHEARDLRRGLGAVLWGEAGIGKSHLLVRLVRWAETDRRGFAAYLHNLQASPENLPRSLLKAVVGILTRGQTHGFKRTPLYDLVFAFVKEALNHDTSVLHPWPAIERAYGKLIEAFSAEDASRAALVDRTTFAVLYQFFRSAYRAHKTGDERLASLAVRWLGGDYLDPAEARLLGLPAARNPDEPASLADNQHIKQVLVALSRMALSGNRPFLLCFDQVDNLDDDQAAALSRFLEALLDGAPNLLVVTAGIQATLLRWRQVKVFQDSAWDRLAQFEIHLLRLSPKESRQLVAARVERVVQPFEDLPAVRQRAEQDALFPLGQAWADAYFHNKIDLRPRDVVNAAREGWRRQQEAIGKTGGPVWLREWGQPTANGTTVVVAELTPAQLQAAVDRKVAQKLAEHADQRLHQPDGLPPDADNLAGLLAGLAKQFGGLEVERPPTGRPNPDFPYSFVVRRPALEGIAGTRTGVLVHCGRIANALTTTLRALVGDTAVERVLLVSEERCPLVFGAQPEAKGRAYYEKLRQRGHGFRHIHLTFDEYVQLDALGAVLGMARSGDLEVELPSQNPRPVNERDALESCRRQGRYQSLPVLGDLCAETTYDETRVEKIEVVPAAK